MCESPVSTPHPAKRAHEPLMCQYRARELNPDEGFPPAVFKTAASAISPARHADSMGRRV
jgi:hypothetical protein